MSTQITRIPYLLVAMALCGLPLAASAKDDLPDKTTDGLERVESKHIDAVYKQPGATLEGYTSVYLVDCAVAFRKNWERDYNRDEIDLSHRVSDKDMDRIKTQLSEEFKKVFTKELERGGYEITDQTGSGVLIVRPALVNLDVTAPDLMTPDMSFTVVQSHGSMTLYMELYDAATNAKIGLVMDAQADPDSMAERANRTTNKAAADRILRRWADTLVKALDEAAGKDKD